jgi:DNA helicase HerA-like ATPase
MPIQDVSEIFIPNRIARLMKMEENEQTRYQYEIWFEYTRQIMTELREGTLLAVRNFSTNQSESHYSILETVSLMPIHYALGERPEGYPGFVMEAARNIATDWTSQEDRSEEDTTIIRCVAMPTGIEIIESHEGRDLIQDQALPMIGSEVRVLTTDATREIVNREISPTQDHVFEGGLWLVNNTVPIYVRTEDFVRVHFGIFGFTGAGKSNLVSTYITNLLSASQGRNRPVKIVLFDLMSEYTVLLLDQLLTLPQAWLLAIGEYSLPGRVIEFMCGNTAQRQNAINDLLWSSLYPKPLERIRNNFQTAFIRLLDQNKIRIRHEPIATFNNFMDRNQDALTEGRLGGATDLVNEIIRELRQTLGRQQMSIAVIDQAIGIINNKPRASTQQARDNISEFLRLLGRERRNLQRTYPLQAILGVNDIIDNLNNNQGSSLFIIQAHNPDELRDFAFELGHELFERRRQQGIIQPLVSFVFDEADEFIPGQYERDSSYSRSAWIAETLARRGRKFGIGVGICTQRVRYLKTSVMAQPHTYLVSKMPRLTDREAIQEAFGFSEDMFRQTFKFAPGDWLLASHDATGLKAVPIPIHAHDANERIKNFLQTLPSSLARQR